MALAELQQDLRYYRESIGDNPSGPNYSALGRFRAQLRESSLEQRLSPSALAHLIEDLQEPRTKELSNRINERIGQILNR